MDNLDFEERQRNAKEIIAWNIAIGQASMNVSCIEANLTIAKRKSELNRLQRHYLAGVSHLERYHKDPVLNPSAWESECKIFYEKSQKNHQDRLKKLINDAQTVQKPLKTEISDADVRINDAVQIINDSKEILKKKVTYFDYDVVGNISELREQIEENRRIIRRLEQRSSGEKTFSRNHERLKSIFSDTSPSLKFI